MKLHQAVDLLDVNVEAAVDGTLVYTRTETVKSPVTFERIESDIHFHKLSLQRIAATPLAGGNKYYHLRQIEALEALKIAAFPQEMTVEVE